jgi:hypothetical protein
MHAFRRERPASVRLSTLIAGGAKGQLAPIALDICRRKTRSPPWSHTKKGSVTGPNEGNEGKLSGIRAQPFLRLTTSVKTVAGGFAPELTLPAPPLQKRGVNSALDIQVFEINFDQRFGSRVQPGKGVTTLAFRLPGPKCGEDAARDQTICYAIDQIGNDGSFEPDCIGYARG